MKSIRIANIRSIEDSGPIELKNITALVGENSAGKSTLMRIIPLLKQSYGVNLAGPLDLTGDLVDYGFFEDIIKRKSPVGEIMIEIDFGRIRSDFILPGKDWIRTMFTEYNLKLTMYIQGKSQNNRLSRLNVCLNDDVYGYVFNDDLLVSIIVNNVKYNMKEYRIECMYNNCILPTFIFPKNKHNEVTERLQVELLRKFGRNTGRIPLVITDLIDKTIHTIKKATNTKLSYQRLIAFIDNYLYSMLTGNSHISNTFIEMPKTFINNYNKQSTDIRNEIHNLCLACNFKSVYEILFDIFGLEMNKIYYIGPVRSLIKRAYMLRNTNITELEFDASNMAMYLKSLKLKESESLNSFMKSTLDVSYKVDAFRGFASIMINEKNSNDWVNLADAGSGYGQIMPVIIQLWLISQRLHRQESTTRGLRGLQTSKPCTNGVYILIEQPELHLHPKVQAKVVDLYTSITQKLKLQNINLSIIFETHSPTMISRLGFNVYKKLISPTDVEVYIFNKIGNKSFVNSGVFNEEGQLQNWPDGFFLPDYE
jgi:predicted ATPase